MLYRVSYTVNTEVKTTFLLCNIDRLASMFSYKDTLKDLTIVGYSRTIKGVDMVHKVTSQKAASILLQKTMG